ncbi:hypothetical protein [Streptomyces gibsoniae]|uniref:Acetyltransferase n=1 Tax=Streptomyces gibsoniae TaxID=3075529 RepID=A0ABU2TPW9_9ACTN|nr:hypothetical protein [Streptomyces sp. DSM 41699]MDT0462983.1 hypothetical protein [Streptomyces sp. DSM 41699]
MTLRVLTTDDWPLWRTLRLTALADAPHAFKSRLADWCRGEQQRWQVRLEVPGTCHAAALLDGCAVSMAGAVNSACRASCSGHRSTPLSVTGST